MSRFSIFSQKVSSSCLHASPEHLSNPFLLFGRLSLAALVASLSHSPSDFFGLHQHKKVKFRFKKCECICEEYSNKTYLALRFFFLRPTVSGSGSRGTSGRARNLHSRRAGRCDSRSTKLPTIASLRNLVASCKRGTW